VAILNGVNLASPGAGSSTITLRDTKEDRDIPVKVISGMPAQISFQIPADFPIGPAILKVSNGVDAALPLAVMIDAPPPVIAGIVNSAGERVDASRSVRAGDKLAILVSGLSADPARDVTGGNVKVEVGGVAHRVQPAVETQAPSGTFPILITLSALVAPGEQVPVTVSVGARVSRSFSIAVRE
jgi:uncharacterized protein (TIGR03437 family)